ncbi:MAG TPA: ABC transporter substrate-binding protein [Bryobacteraceae bacterium]|jgi:peptide/nickel transport system substrate-binding protein|nr:ABC transporter substrate-binding protein [Bryobacteraceae bacterium]
MLIRIAIVLLLGGAVVTGAGNELRFCLRTDPKTFNPLLVEDESSATVRFLTGGVLIRLNRYTQELEGELATKWKVSENGRRIDFELRHGVRFSDGTPFTCQDVAYTMRRLMDPALHSPVSDPLRSAPGDVETKCAGPSEATVRFPGAVADLAAQFDQVAMVSATSPQKEAAVLGPFELGEYKPGAYVLLRRNPNYWKRDGNGHALPYLDSIRLDIQQNRELELLRFRRGELDIINKLDPDMYDRLSSEMPHAVADAGPSLDWETVFFNQVDGAPLPEYKRAWFRSADFRRAISEGIRRDDIVRIVYHGHARAAVGPVSVANRFWLNPAMKPGSGSEAAALALLQRAGFRREGGALLDSAGNKVEFSMITNAGNKLHERMLALIQQDLARLGIQLNVVVLDFPSLIERISRTFNYESVLMAFTNVDLDPSAQMNIWLSSAANHQWNPSQKTPASAWEAEIDKLMQAQNAAQDPKKRKASFDQVQQIVADQVPILFLVNPNALSAVAPNVKNVTPAVLAPHIFWNADRLQVGGTLLSQR